MAARIPPRTVDPGGYDPGSVSNKNIAGMDMPCDIGEYFIGDRAVFSVINKKTRLRPHFCGRLRYQFLRKIIIKIACFQKLSLSPPFSGNHYRLNPDFLQQCGRQQFSAAGRLPFIPVYNPIITNIPLTYSI
jgi:hypothetical protein